MYLEILTPSGFQPFTGIKRSVEDVFRVDFADGGHIEATAGHLFKTKAGANIPLEALRTGDTIAGRDGRALRITGIVHTGAKPVYDAVEVAAGNLYYTAGVVSHNCEFHGSADTLLSGAKLQRMTHVNPEYVEKEGMFKIYRRPVPGRSYVVTADTSEGVGRDYSVCAVIDVSETPYRLVAKYRHNIIPPLLFAKTVWNIATYYNEAVVVVESNSVGSIVCNELWYTYEYENMITSKAFDGENRVSGAAKSQPGVRTTVRTKAIGCSNLKSLIEGDMLIVEDFDTIQEFAVFCAKGKSYEAVKGKTDDFVMALVVFAWFANEPYFAEMVDLNVRNILRDQLESMAEFDMLTVYFDDGLDTSAETLPI